MKAGSAMQPARPLVKLISTERAGFNKSLKRCGLGSGNSGTKNTRLDIEGRSEKLAAETTKLE